jgi:agmatinase
VSIRPTLLGLPYDASSSYLRGAAEGPRAIREALFCPSSNGWSEDGIDVLSALEDAGDLALPETATADARRLVEEGIARLLAEGKTPISLGGDHSVTYPVLRAFRPRFPSLTILHFDAHPDLYEEFEGDRFSHACPFARILEERLASRLVQAGIRTATAHQREQIARYRVEVIDMRAWDRGVRPAVTGPVYVTVDIDGFDPAYAPGVSHPESGGLSPRDVVGAIQALDGPIVGADVVELNPRRDVNGLTAALAAKLVKELASRILSPGSST